MLGSSIPVFLSFYHQTISHTIFCVRQWLEFAFQDLHKYFRLKHYTFSKRALTTVSTRAIIINQTLGIWHRAVKLLVVFHKYWLEVLEGNHSSSSLKIFVEPKAIYFTRCFYTVSLLYAQIQFQITIWRRNLPASHMAILLDFFEYTGKPFSM